VVRVRFAPSPTGSLHLGSALTAAANRRFADANDGVAVLRIDDTDQARVDPLAEAALLRDLDWLELEFEEGPLRQSDRTVLYAAAAERLVDAGVAELDNGAIRFLEGHRATLVRREGTPTYHLASVVDDIDLRITHVIRGKDHLPNQPLHEKLARALGATPPKYIHHGLLVGDDGAKLSKRHGASSVAELREQGIPPEAVRRYLDELGLPRGDVQLDLRRIRRLAIEVIAELGDEDLTARVGAPVKLAPALRGARDLAEARAFADGILVAPASVAIPPSAALTLERFRELRERGDGELTQAGAREIVRELKSVGGDLRALRLALTGAERGPELWTILLGLALDETLRRIDAAL
jgi:hypothetical protein